MPILYKMKRITAPHTSASGKFYALAQHTGTWRTRDVARIIQANCSLKESDVLAVVSELVCTMKLLLQDSQRELVETMSAQLQNSMRVKLDGLGAFKIGLKTKGAATAAEFSAGKNVVGMRVNFQPEAKTDANGTRQQALLNGAKVQEAPKNDVRHHHSNSHRLGIRH